MYTWSYIPFSHATAVCCLWRQLADDSSDMQHDLGQASRMLGVWKCGKAQLHRYITRVTTAAP
jgi:hypothetical protein